MANPNFRVSKVENGEIVEVTMCDSGESLSMAAFLQRQAEGAIERYTQDLVAAVNREAERLCEEAVRLGHFVPGETKLVIVDGWPVGYQKPGETDDELRERLFPGGK